MRPGVVNALSPYGVLSRDALRREAGALHWHEPLLDRALEEAAAEGQIAELPLGLRAAAVSTGCSRSLPGTTVGYNVDLISNTNARRMSSWR